MQNPADRLLCFVAVLDWGVWGGHPAAVPAALRHMPLIGGVSCVRGRGRLVTLSVAAKSRFERVEATDVSQGSSANLGKARVCGLWSVIQGR